jgi:hypothetical protein
VEDKMRRSMLTLLAALLLLAGVVAVAPEPAQARTSEAPTSARRATDPFVGNWYRGKMWFRIRGPVNGKFRAAWSNGSGAMIRYTIKKGSDGVYYETANPRNTYRLLNAYTVKVHYETTGGGYVTRKFQRVG